MRVLAYDLLWVVPLAPVGAALLLSPFSRRLPRPFFFAMAWLAWLASLAAAAAAFATVLDAGGWAELTTTGFRGAQLIARDPSGEGRLVGDPLGVLLSLGFAVAAGVTLLTSVGAWGGGPRTSPRPVTGGQLLGLLLVYGLAQATALAADLQGVLGAAVLASLVGWALLSSTEPKRDQRDAAGHLFVLHRVGDVSWALALALVVTSWGMSDGPSLARSSAATDAWARVAEGPLLGFPASTLFSMTGLLVLVGVASRVPLLPLPMLYRHASGLPAPALGLVHGMGTLGLGVVVLLRTAPLWDRSGAVGTVALVLAAGAALLAALAAAASRDVIRIDLHLLHALSALAVVSALVGQAPAAALLALTVVTLAPCLLASTGNVLEALQGRYDIFEMGGLWRSLKISDRTRALSTLALSSLPPFATWLALERTLVEATDSRFAQPAAAVLLVVTAGVVTFAGFRALHLVYSGDAPRVTPPANLVEAPLWRSLPPLFLSFLALALPAVAALPSAIADAVLPGHQEPFQRFLEPVWLFLSFEPLTEESTRGLSRVGLSTTWRYAGMAALAAAGVVGYALSAALYRRGPTKLHARLVTSTLPSRTAALAESSLGLERVFLVWLPTIAIQVARVFTAVILGALLDVLITRAVALIAAVTRTLIRSLHNGDVQRALFFAVLFAAALLFAWGRA